MALTHTQVGVIVASCAGAGAVILFTLLIYFVTRHRNSFSFLRRPNPSPPDIEMQNLSPRAPSGDFETYGKLTLGPGHRPISTALGIINHALMYVGLPAGTTKTGAPQGSLRPVSETPSQFTNNVQTEAEASADGLYIERNAIRQMAIARHQLRELKEEEAREQRLKAAAYRAPKRMDSGTAFSIIRPPASESTSRLVGQFSLDPAKAKVVGLEQMQDIFVVGGGEEEEGDMEIVVDPMSGTWGTGKGMAALYHAHFAHPLDFHLTEFTTLRAKVEPTGGEIIHDYQGAACGFVFKIMDDNLLHHFAEDIKCGNSDIELKGLNAEAEAAERNSRRSKKKREAEEKKEGGKRRKTGAGGESLV